MSILVKPIGGGPSDLPKAGSKIIVGMREAIVRVCLLLMGNTKRKLSDDVLKVRTGRLRRSITQEVLDKQDVIIGQVGTNVNYAAAHEFGVNMDVQIQEHIQLRKEAFGKMLSTPVWTTVRAHTRHMVLPERSFLRSALEEMKDELPKEIKYAVSSAGKL